MKYPLQQAGDAVQSDTLPLLHRPEFQRSSAPRTTRYRLWELQNCWHCMVVGTCLTLTEVRQQAAKAGMDIRDRSDYQIHQFAVENAANGKHQLAQRLQKLLEKKFAVAIKRFRAARDEPALIEMWESGWRTGDVASSLWAVITHPLSTRSIIMDVFGQVHMMSHLAGASTCVDRNRLQEQDRQLQALESELHALRKRHDQTSEALCEQTRRHDAQRLENHRLLGQLQGLEAEQSRDEQPATANRQRLAASEQLIAQLQERLQVLEKSQQEQVDRNEELQQDVLQLEALLESRLGGEPDEPRAPPCPRAGQLQLCGQCVLFLGGKTHQRRHFQALVESCEGRFLHHDGGRETCPHRISELVSQADVVMCPTDYISHSAMQKARNLCARQDKPMIFMQRSSLSAFTRSLYETINRGEPANQSDKGAASANPVAD